MCPTVKHGPERLAVRTVGCLTWLCSLLFFGVGLGNLVLGDVTDASTFWFWLGVAAVSFAGLVYRREVVVDKARGTLTVRRALWFVPVWKAEHRLDRVEGMGLQQEGTRENTDYHVDLWLSARPGEPEELDKIDTFDERDESDASSPVRVYSSCSAERAWEFAQELGRLLDLNPGSVAPESDRWLYGLAEAFLDGPREFAAHVRRLLGRRRG